MEKRGTKNLEIYVDLGLTSLQEEDGDGEDVNEGAVKMYQL